MDTIIKTASVKVMLSYDYSHFEASMSLENENGISINEIDSARKKCQRLADKAVEQYRIAKEKVQNRSNAKYDSERFENACQRIADKNECDRTIKEIAMFKQFRDEDWQSQFTYPYDYDDDENYNLH